MVSGSPQLMSNDNVAAKVARGGAILMIGQVALRLVRLGSLVILARLLSPEDYGLVALALVVSGLLEVVSDLQVRSALLRLTDIRNSHLNTAFFISLVRGALIAAILFLFAGPLARLMGEPELAPAFRWLSLGPVIGSLANPRLVLFEKRIDFSRELAISLASTLVGAAITILIALWTRDYWALIFGGIATQAASVVAGYVVMPYRPRIETVHWRSFVDFGGWLTGASIIAYLNYRSDVALIGTQIGQTALGQYSMGDRVAQMVTNELVQPFARAFYPGLASVRHDRARLRSAYYKAQGVILLLMLPVGIGAAICAPEIVTLVLGPKWDQAIIVIQFVAPLMAINLMNAPVQALAMTVGDTRSLFLRSLYNFLLRVPLILIGLWSHGILGVLVARLVSGTAFTVSTLNLARGQTGDPFWTPFLASWRSIASVAMMGLAVMATRFGLEQGGHVPLGVKTFVLIAAGACSYLLCHILLWLAAGRPDGAEQVMLTQLGNLKAGMVRKGH